MTHRQAAQACANHRDRISAIVKANTQLPKSDRAALADAAIDLDRLHKFHLALAGESPASQTERP
jgi:hypothetical protein